MKVELSVHASKLKNVAGLGKGTSDPYAVITHVATKPGESPTVIGKTEVMKNDLSPNWAKVFTIDYKLGTPYKVIISVMDEVRKHDNKPMGSATFDVGECLGARGCTKAKKLKGGGTVFCHVSKAAGSGVLRLKLKGTKLKNVEGLIGKSDPFFELSNRRDAAGGLTWDVVYRSKKVKNNLNPDWEAAMLDLSPLCQGDLDKPILVSVWDYESKGKHVAMGSFQTSVNGLKDASGRGNAFTLKQKGKDVGKITVTKAEVSGIESVTQQMAASSVSPPPRVAAAPVVATPYAAPSTPHAPRPNFVDYVSGGCEFNVAVAIDFTGSNGDPRKPGTLHHLSPQKNQYEQAIMAIVGVLSNYDTDQTYPVYGFGAKYGGIVRHCFQCGPTAEVQGIDGILSAYHQTFKSGLIMSGPTVFTEVIQTAAARATSAQETAKVQGKQSYSILLILTDGAVSDVRATADVLNQVSGAPLSIVIVGIGNADFSTMQFLDDSGEPGTPDIVQFVEFNKHNRSAADLTSATLEEIPDQMVNYFQRHGIAPLPPISRGDNEIVVEAEDEIDLSLDFAEDGEIVVAAGGSDFASGFGR